MSIKTIFYDFDGVIKESTDIKSKAFFDLYFEFGETIAKQVEEYHIAHGGISRFEKIKYFHKTHLGIAITPEKLKKWANKFSNLVLQKVVESPYVTGALETITKLNKAYNQFIITGTPQNEIELICKKLNISPLFKQICGSPTNKIQWCNKLLLDLHLSPNEIVFVGDATTDYEAAMHHKLHFILREHEENKVFFNDKQLIKVQNLVNLEDEIKNII